MNSAAAEATDREESQALAWRDALLREFVVVPRRSKLGERRIPRARLRADPGPRAPCEKPRRAGREERLCVERGRFSGLQGGLPEAHQLRFLQESLSAIAKRIFRFLDKRFYQQNQVGFDLRTFVREHLGLSRKYHNGERKRVLGAAIRELEAKGFLKPCPIEKRFVRKDSAWQIAFARAGTQQPKAANRSNAIAEALVKRGVSRHSAERLVATTDDARIRERI